MKKEIFLSYSWINKAIVDDIESSLKNTYYNIIRDEHTLSYKSSIKEYMNRIRKSEFALMIITKEFIQSSNCMYEVLSILKDENYRVKILPIVHEEAKIFSPEGRIEYIEYWQNKYEELRNKLATIDPKNAISEYEELKQYENIAEEISIFLKQLADMNCIIYKKRVSGIDLDKIKEYIGIFSNESNTYYILSKTKTIEFELNTFIWWAPNSDGYTDELVEAGRYTKEEAVKIVVPFSEQFPFTKSIGIPVAIAKIIFQQSIVPYNGRFRDLLLKNKDMLLGDMKWKLPNDVF